MNFYVDSGGAILGVDPEKIYQGSANANTIRFVGAFASNVKVTVAFKLPTGVWTTPQLMTASTQLAGVVTSNGVQFNVWEYSIPALVTETFGTVNMQFYVYGDAGSGNGGLIATASSSFQVERGVPITLPDPTDDYETLLTQILSALSQIEGQIPGMEEDITGLQSKVSDLSENKLDKVSGNTTYKQAYAKDTNGDQIMQNYSTENVTNAIVQRDETGNIKITPGRKGYMNDGATMRNIADVESEVAKKYDKTGGTIDGNVTVTGDLTVQGTTITENAETLDVKANVITTNSEGVPLINLSGLGIRTDATNVYGIMYDPQNDSVKLGLGSLDEDNNFTFNQGEGLPIAVRDDSTAFTDKHVIVWDAAGDKFVDGGKAVSDLPTLAGNNDFTGENTFEEAIQAKKGTVVKNSLDETNYNAGYISRNDWTYLFPADSGTFALTKNIPTDYATQTALANTQRQVDGLYTLLEQKNEIYVQTATDTYTTRETAGGENIADGVQTPVKKITGKTVKTTNQFAIENLNGGSGSAGNALSVSGAQITVTNYYACSTVKTFRQLVPNAHAGTYTIFFNLSTNGEFRESTANGAIAIVDAAGSLYLSSSSFTSGGAKSNTFTITEERLDSTVYFYGIGQEGITVSWTNLMIVEGDVTSNPPSYSDYFSGLKNAFFKEIVSTGRNLIPYPYADGMSKAENGITFTVNTDGTITVNGTATARAQFFLYQNKEELMGMEKGKTCICSMNDSSTNLLIYADYYSNGEWKYPAFTSTGSNFVVPDSWEGVQLYILVESGETLSNLVLKPMLNYGSSALPYEPYTQSVLSLPEAVELTEYDTAYPETGEIQRQSNTLTFNGTETWNDLSDDTRYIYGINLPTPAVLAPYKGVICNLFPSSDVNGVYLTGIVDGTYKSLAAQFLKSSFPQFDSVTAWKAYLAAQSAAGNPLTVTYKTAEVQSTKQADFSADSYIAWKNGSETIKQGDTDNSIYGAENTVEQDYYLLTAPQEVTKE